VHARVPPRFNLDASPAKDGPCRPVGTNEEDDAVGRCGSHWKPDAAGDNSPCYAIGDDIIATLHFSPSQQQQQEQQQQQQQQQEEEEERQGEEEKEDTSGDMCPATPNLAGDTQPFDGDNPSTQPPALSDDTASAAEEPASHGRFVAITANHELQLGDHTLEHPFSPTQVSQTLRRSNTHKLY